jgi:predicted nucleic acid-binding protein
MSLILDTSILIEIERRNIELINILKKYSEIYPGPPKITFISYFEFLNGLKNKNIKNKDKSILFIEKFTMLNITKRTAEILSDLKYNNETKGISLPLADLLIASQTIENKDVLITRDKDFESIENLKVIII